MKHPVGPWMVLVNFIFFNLSIGIVLGYFSADPIPNEWEAPRFQKRSA